MAGLADQNVTHLIQRVSAGDDAALPLLLDAAYKELRAVAGNLFKDQPGDHTLQPTALVNELCLRLLDKDECDWNDRKHFIRAAATAMRNLLADHARAKRAEKRGGGGGGGGGVGGAGGEGGVGGGGGGAATVALDPGSAPAARGSTGYDIVALDETLTRLAQANERLGRVVELRFLAGLSVAQTADLLGVSERTIEIDTKLIRAWLQKELGA